MNREARGWHAGGQAAHERGTARYILGMYVMLLEYVMLVQLSLTLLFLYKHYQICKCWVA